MLPVYRIEAYKRESDIDHISYTFVAFACATYYATNMSSSQCGGPSRAPAAGCGAGRIPGRSTTQPQQPVQQSSSKFKGNCLSLEGQIFDCSDYKQANKYQSTIKQISEYIRSEFKHGGDICSSIMNEAKITIPSLRPLRSWIPTRQQYQRNCCS